MELDPELLKLLAGLSPWVLLLALIVWPDKGIVALWIKRSHATKLAEIERDKAKLRVQERALKRLEQEPRLKLPPKGDLDDRAG